MLKEPFFRRKKKMQDIFIPFSQDRPLLSDVSTGSLFLFYVCYTYPKYLSNPPFFLFPLKFLCTHLKTFPPLMPLSLPSLTLPHLITASWGSALTAPPSDCGRPPPPAPFPVPKKVRPCQEVL